MRACQGTEPRIVVNDKNFHLSNVGLTTE